jgi:hypothetical protein
MQGNLKIIMWIKVEQRPTKHCFLDPLTTSQVHPYTAREEIQFRFRGLRFEEELELLLVTLKVDAIISDSIPPIRSYLEHRIDRVWNMTLASAPSAHTLCR